MTFYEALEVIALTFTAVNVREYYKANKWLSRHRVGSQYHQEMAAEKRTGERIYLGEVICHNLGWHGREAAYMLNDRRLKKKDRSIK
ncbi:MAG: hypothetical protein KKH52_04115 [Nanoarchaeota archaeon]|nr:hypothetical protein [Nanoarchaeota archaeon]MBU1623307.1 hypothetical protein [Nanoarchaeota archaeon]MBU1974555.1 hypothetical protein [Nanoarchaeota archaeon]